MDNQKTLRDEFAISAIQSFGMLNPNWNSCTVENIAAWAYRLADAMLAERNKKDK